MSVRGRHLDGSVGSEDSVAWDQVDALALQVEPDLLTHDLRNPASPEAKPFQGEVGGEAQPDAVDLLALEPGQVEGGLAQGLGGYPAPIDGSTARAGTALDHGYPLAEIGGERRRFLARRTRANRHEVVFLHRSSLPCRREHREVTGMTTVHRVAISRRAPAAPDSL